MDFYRYKLTIPSQGNFYGILCIHMKLNPPCCATTSQGTATWSCPNSGTHKPLEVRVETARWWRDGDCNHRKWGFMIGKPIGKWWFNGILLDFMGFYGIFLGFHSWSSNGWYLGKFHHDQKLFSRSLGIMVFIGKSSLFIVNDTYTSEVPSGKPTQNYGLNHHVIDRKTMENIHVISTLLEIS